MHDIRFLKAAIFAGVMGYLIGSFVSNIPSNHLAYGIELKQYVDTRVAEMEAFHNEMYERYNLLEDKVDKL